MEHLTVDAIFVAGRGRWTEESANGILHRDKAGRPRIGAEDDTTELAVAICSMLLIQQPPLEKTATKAVLGDAQLHYDPVQ